MAWPLGSAEQEAQPSWARPVHTGRLRDDEVQTLSRQDGRGSKFGQRGGMRAA